MGLEDVMQTQTELGSLIGEFALFYYPKFGAAHIGTVVPYAHYGSEEGGQAHLPQADKAYAFLTRCGKFVRTYVFWASEVVVEGDRITAKKGALFDFSDAYNFTNPLAQEMLLILESALSPHATQS